MTTPTYPNGTPRIGWCASCERPVSLTTDGWLVPHMGKGGRKRCREFDYISMEDHAAMVAESTGEPST